MFFKGLCLFLLPNIPGATFIQGGTFIPDSRVRLLLLPRDSNEFFTISTFAKISRPFVYSGGYSTYSLVMNHINNLVFRSNHELI